MQRPIKLLESYPGHHVRFAAEAMAAFIMLRCDPRYARDIDLDTIKGIARDARICADLLLEELYGE